MKITTTKGEDYEDCDLIAVLGDLYLFRCPAEDSSDEPLDFALPVRSIYAIDFEKSEEVKIFKDAHPFGWVKT